LIWCESGVSMGNMKLGHVQLMCTGLLVCLACLSWRAAWADPLALQADIANLENGNKVLTTFVVRGRAFNAGTEGALIEGGLQAFHCYGAGRDPAGGRYPTNDLPPAGHLQEGTNSEFAANPTSYANWWLHNDASFRSAHGIPSDPLGDQWLPPYKMRQVFNVLTNPADDVTWPGDNFVVRMEGRLVIPADGSYTLTGGGDDRVAIYVDGRKVYDQWLSGQYNGSVFLTAGEHGFTVDFQENGGGQWYGFSLPTGASLKAAPRDEHIFQGWTLEYGRYYEEQRNGMLTLCFRANVDGSGGPIGGTNFFKGISSESYGSYDIGPSPQADNYRMYMVGYWYAPQDGTYDFTGGADDRYGLAITNDEAGDPWTIPLVMDNAPASGIYLTQGWKPFRMEFGEGGGSAGWSMQWRVNSGIWNYFQPSNFKSTAARAYDWTLVTNSPAPCASETNLAVVALGDLPEGTLVDVRLRAVGTDLSYAEETVQVEVTAAGGPLIRNETPTNTTASAADFRGYLVSTGRAETAVFLCWGLQDGGTNDPGNWDHVQNLGVPSPGAVSTNVGLLTNAVTWYRYWASNSWGVSWATNACFVVPGEVNITVDSAEGKEVPPTPMVFSFSRPSWSTGVALRVFFQTGGTAVPGYDYTSPGNSVVIPAGSISQTLPVWPLADTNGQEGTETLVLTLAAAGYYLVGTPGSAMGTIEDYKPMDLHAAIASPAPGERVSPRFSVQGVAYNGTPEVGWQDGGMEAFARAGLTPCSRHFDLFPVARGCPDIPQANELSSGTNSLFVGDPLRYDSWWLHDTASWRASNGIPGSATDQWLPPWVMRKVFGALSSSSDDNWGWGDDFSVRLEGRVVAPSNMMGRFWGGADDMIVIYLDGCVVYNNRAATVSDGWAWLAAGEHALTVDFYEMAGGQNYQFWIPNGCTLRANPPYSHTFGVWTLELGRWYSGERRAGALTLRVRDGWSGAGSYIGTTTYFRCVSAQFYGNDIGPSPQVDNYRIYMAGYWHVPTNGVYDFQGGADDRYALAITNNPDADPWTIPLVMDNAAVNGVSLTEGWKPFRMEFGDIGGKAEWSMLWRVNGGSWSYFYPSNFMSTEDLAFEWTLITNGIQQCSSPSSLATVVLRDVATQEVAYLRLRAIGSDRSFAEHVVPIRISPVRGTIFIAR